MTRSARMERIVPASVAFVQHFSRAVDDLRLDRRLAPPAHVAGAGDLEARVAAVERGDDVSGAFGGEHAVVRGDPASVDVAAALDLHRDLLRVTAGEPDVA